MIINQGFTRKRESDHKLPPGQYEEKMFPVLSLGATPHISKDEWRLEISGLVENPTTIDYAQLTALPSEDLTKDIHCVTKWSNFETKWTAVPLQKVFDQVGLLPTASHLYAYADDGDTTNLTLSEIVDEAWLAYKYNGLDLEDKHGGPVRLLVPKFYFWKSIKWITKIELMDHDQKGFWESRGYHNHGDPWKEERYSGFFGL